MSHTSPPSAFEGAPFTHLDNMIAAFAKATDPEEKRLFLRGALRSIELVTGQLHTRLSALVDAATAQNEFTGVK
jgi:hypothetical protein